MYIVYNYKHKDPFKANLISEYKTMQIYQSKYIFVFPIKIKDNYVDTCKYGIAKMSNFLPHSTIYIYFPY